MDIRVFWNQLDALFILTLFSHYTSAFNGLASGPLSGRDNVYMLQLVRDARLSRLSAGLDGLELLPFHPRPPTAD
jgi:hypothetical protein